MQVDDLDAAQTHLDFPVHLRHVAVPLPLCCPRKQRQFEAEHLLTHDGHGLQGEGGRGRHENCLPNHDCYYDHITVNIRTTSTLTADPGAAAATR